MTAISQEDAWITNINYELSTLCELPRWAAENSLNGPAAVEHACTEATLLHARLMIEFLAGRPRRDGTRAWNANDVTPEHFLPEWSVSDPERLDHWLLVIDQHLAHLSRSRGGAGTAPDGYLTTVVDAVLGAFEEFTRALAERGSQHASAFSATLAQARTKRLQSPAVWPPPRGD